MAENEIATALELMQGGLKFEHDADGWWWAFREQVSTLNFTSELDAVRNFCQRYATVRTVKDAPQPGPFDLDAFMMDGIEALVKAASEEMRTRGQEFDAETVAGALARAWHGHDGALEALHESGLEFIKDGTVFRWSYNNYVSEDGFTDKETAILDFMATVAMEFRTP